MPFDVHNELHRRYGPPETPTHEQAAVAVINAFERGEQFRYYDHSSGLYYNAPIPKEFVDMLMREYRVPSLMSFR